MGDARRDHLIGGEADASLVTRNSSLETKDGGTFGPEPLDLVKLAPLGIEDVDDDVAEVDQNPARLNGSLPLKLLDVGLLHFLVDAVVDCLDLPAGLAAADDEIIGKGAYITSVK